MSSLPQRISFRGPIVAMVVGVLLGVLCGATFALQG